MKEVKIMIDVLTDHVFITSLTSNRILLAYFVYLS